MMTFSRLATGLMIALLLAGASAGAQQSEEPSVKPAAASAPEKSPPPLPQVVIDPAKPPQCTAETEGMVACMANRLCECGYAQAIPARGLPARWRWDCSIKRPACSVAPAELGAELSGGSSPIPATVLIDQRRGDRDRAKKDKKPKDN